MNRLVIDSSVGAKWFFDEERSLESLEIINGSNELHAPELFVLEVENIICKKLRRREIDLDYARESRLALREIQIELHSHTTLIDPAFELAVTTGRSLYDCLFLALAGLMDATLVTADRRFFESIAAGPLGRHIRYLGNHA